MYTLPDGVRTRHDGSKSTPKSFGLLATPPAIKRALFMRLIVGLRGGTSGGAVGVTPSRRKPAKNGKKNICLISRETNKYTYILLPLVKYALLQYTYMYKIQAYFS